MDFSLYGLAAGLMPAVGRLRSAPALHDSMLSHAVLNRENVCARLDIGVGREEIFILPALDWILSATPERKGRVLLLTPDADSAVKAGVVAKTLGTPLGVSVRTLSGDEVPGGSEFPESLVAGTLSAVLAAFEGGGLSPRDFGFLVVDGLDAIAEQAGNRMEALRALLPPSWEMRAILVCSRFTGKARKLARDLAENLSEISIDETFLRMRSIRSETYHIDSDAKLRFLLGLAEREKPEFCIVFCNLRDTAADLTRRLSANGLNAKPLPANLPPFRHRSAEAGAAPPRGSFFVASDEGAGKPAQGRFSLVVNFDIPLEPELYGKRLAWLDPHYPGSKVVNLACERYVYGLPAIEGLVGFSLNAVEAPKAMLDHADVSAVAADSRPVQGRDMNREGRRPRKDRGAEAAPLIMMSVDEAAGRMTAQKMREEGGIRPAQVADAAGRRQGGASGKSPDKATHSGRQTRPRSLPDRKKAGSEQTRRADRPVGKSRAASQGTSDTGMTGRAADPYSLSMEERLRSYREKYGEGRGGGGDRGRSPQAAVSRPSSPSGVLPEARLDDRIPDKNDRIDEAHASGNGLLGKIANLFRKNSNLH